MIKLPTLEYDSVLGIITIDGNRIDSAIDININHKSEDSYSTVTLTFEADVKLSGNVLILPHAGVVQERMLRQLLKEYE